MTGIPLDVIIESEITGAFGEKFPSWLPEGSVAQWETKAWIGELW